LLHVSDGETSKWGIVGEDFAGHGLGGNHVDHAGISTLNKFGELFFNDTSSLVHLGENFLELAGNVRSVAVQHGAVSVLDLSRVVHDDHLGLEVGDFSSRVILGIRSNVSSLNIFHREIFNVESNIVSWDSLSQLFVVHFHRLHIGGEHNGGKSNVHVGSDDTSLNTSHGNGSNTSDLVDIL